MARLTWTEPALEQLDAIADYIALDKPAAAKALVRRVFDAVVRLERFPASGRMPPELPDSVYREIVCSPCRIFYRQEGEKVFIVYVMRDEGMLRHYLLEE